MRSSDRLDAWCENVWCGMEFEAAQGWAGLCPSCATLLDEHWAGLHDVRLARDAEPPECPQCRRATAEAVRASA